MKNLYNVIKECWTVSTLNTKTTLVIIMFLWNYKMASILSRNDQKKWRVIFVHLSDIVINSQKGLSEAEKRYTIQLSSDLLENLSNGLIQETLSKKKKKTWPYFLAHPTGKGPLLFFKKWGKHLCPYYQRRGMYTLSEAY